MSKKIEALKQTETDKKFDTDIASLLGDFKDIDLYTDEFLVDFKKGLTKSSYSETKSDNLLPEP